MSAEEDALFDAIVSDLDDVEVDGDLTREEQERRVIIDPALPRNPRSAPFFPTWNPCSTAPSGPRRRRNCAWPRP